MLIKLKVEKEFDIKYLNVFAGVRYWEDGTVDGIEDTDGDFIPCKTGDYWCPTIDINTGQIVNWQQGVVADIHYKICDDGSYFLIDIDNNLILKQENCYVPGCLSPNGGDSDYIVMKIDENGFIENWYFDINDFINE